MDKKESRSEKFKRLASRRVNELLKKLGNMGKLSSANYEYTEEEVDKIFVSLQQAMDEAKSKFSKKTRKGDSFVL